MSLKAMLPEPFEPWYVQGEASADSQQAEEAALSLGASRHLSNGSQLTTSIGVTHRDYRTRARQKIGSDVLNVNVQWKLSERLGIGMTLRYYLDAGDVDALLSLEIKSLVTSSSPVHRQFALMIPASSLPSVCQGSPPPFLPWRTVWKPSMKRVSARSPVCSKS